jgi:hypothetical protein
VCLFFFRIACFFYFLKNLFLNVKKNINPNLDSDNSGSNEYDQIWSTSTIINNNYEIHQLNPDERADEIEDFRNYVAKYPTPFLTKYHEAFVCNPIEGSSIVKLVEKLPDIQDFDETVAIVDSVIIDHVSEDDKSITSEEVTYERWTEETRLFKTKVFQDGQLVDEIIEESTPELIGDILREKLIERHEHIKHISQDVLKLVKIKSPGQSRRQSLDLDEIMNENVAGSSVIIVEPTIPSSAVSCSSKRRNSIGTTHLDNSYFIQHQQIITPSTRASSYSGRNYSLTEPSPSTSSLSISSDADNNTLTMHDFYFNTSSQSNHHSSSQSSITLQYLNKLNAANFNEEKFIKLNNIECCKYITCSNSPKRLNKIFNINRRKNLRSNKNGASLNFPSSSSAAATTTTPSFIANFNAQIANTNINNHVVLSGACTTSNQADSSLSLANLNQKNISNANHESTNNTNNNNNNMNALNVLDVSKCSSENKICCNVTSNKNNNKNNSNETNKPTYKDSLNLIFKENELEIEIQANPAEQSFGNDVTSKSKLRLKTSLSSLNFEDAELSLAKAKPQSNISTYYGGVEARLDDQANTVLIVNKDENEAKPSTHPPMIDIRSPSQSSIDKRGDLIKSQYEKIVEFASPPESYNEDAGNVDESGYRSDYTRKSLKSLTTTSMLTNERLSSQNWDVLDKTEDERNQDEDQADNAAYPKRQTTIQFSEFDQYITSEKLDEESEARQPKNINLSMSEVDQPKNKSEISEVTTSESLESMERFQRPSKSEMKRKQAEKLKIKEEQEKLHEAVSESVATENESDIEIETDALNSRQDKDDEQNTSYSLLKNKIRDLHEQFEISEVNTEILDLIDTSKIQKTHPTFVDSLSNNEPDKESSLNVNKVASVVSNLEHAQMNTYFTSTFSNQPHQSTQIIKTADGKQAKQLQDDMTDVSDDEHNIFSSTHLEKINVETGETNEPKVLTQSPPSSTPSSLACQTTKVETSVDKPRNSPFRRESFEMAQKDATSKRLSISALVASKSLNSSTSSSCPSPPIQLELPQAQTASVQFAGSTPSTIKRQLSEIKPKNPTSPTNQTMSNNSSNNSSNENEGYGLKRAEDMIEKEKQTAVVQDEAVKDLTRRLNESIENESDSSDSSSNMLKRNYEILRQKTNEKLSRSSSANKNDSTKPVDSFDEDEKAYQDKFDSLICLNKPERAKTPVSIVDTQALEQLEDQQSYVSSHSIKTAIKLSQPSKTEDLSSSSFTQTPSSTPTKPNKIKIVKKHKKEQKQLKEETRIPIDYRVRSTSPGLLRRGPDIIETIETTTSMSFIMSKNVNLVVEEKREPPFTLNSAISQPQLYQSRIDDILNMTDSLIKNTSHHNSIKVNYESVVEPVKSTPIPITIQARSRSEPKLEHKLNNYCNEELDSDENSLSKAISNRNKLAPSNNNNNNSNYESLNYNKLKPASSSSPKSRITFHKYDSNEIIAVVNVPEAYETTTIESVTKESDYNSLQNSLTQHINYRRHPPKNNISTISSNSNNNNNNNNNSLTKKPYYFQTNNSAAQASLNSNSTFNNNNNNNSSSSNYYSDLTTNYIINSNYDGSINKYINSQPYYKSFSKSEPNLLENQELNSASNLSPAMINSKLDMWKKLPEYVVDQETDTSLIEAAENSRPVWIKSEESSPVQHGGVIFRKNNEIISKSCVRLSNPKPAKNKNVEFEIEIEKRPPSAEQQRANLSSTSVCLDGQPIRARVSTNRDGRVSIENVALIPGNEIVIQSDYNRSFGNYCMDGRASCTSAGTNTTMPMDQETIATRMSSGYFSGDEFRSYYNNSTNTNYNSYTCTNYYENMPNSDGHSPVMSTNLSEGANQFNINKFLNNKKRNQVGKNDALEEFNKLYKSLRLEEDDTLLDRANARDYPLYGRINVNLDEDKNIRVTSSSTRPHQGAKYRRSHSSHNYKYESDYATPDFNNNDLNEASRVRKSLYSRKSAIPDAVKDDMARRTRLLSSSSAYNQANERDYYSSQSYLAKSPVNFESSYYPSSNYSTKPYQPNIARDDASVLNSRKRSNSMTSLSNNNYCNAEAVVNPLILPSPTSADYLRNRTRESALINVVMNPAKTTSDFELSQILYDDMAYRQLRKDSDACKLSHVKSTPSATPTFSKLTSITTLPHHHHHHHHHQHQHSSPCRHLNYSDYYHQTFTSTNDSNNDYLQLTRRPNSTISANESFNSNASSTTNNNNNTIKTVKMIKQKDATNKNLKLNNTATSYFDSANR